MNDIFYGLKDIVGPKTLGPSSSHFSGPAKAGKFVNFYNEGLPQNIEIFLYNSMCDTGVGHRTPQGILGGLYGIDKADQRINGAWKKVCKQSSVKIFMKHDKADKADPYFKFNPNKIEIMLPNTGTFFRFYSTGGSNIIFSVIDGVECSINASGWVCFIKYSQKQKDALVKLAKKLKLNYCLCSSQMIIEGKSLVTKNELFKTLYVLKFTTKDIRIIDNL